MSYDLEQERLRITTVEEDNNNTFPSFAFPGELDIKKASQTPAHQLANVRFSVPLKIIMHLCQYVEKDVVELVWNRMVGMAKFSKSVCFAYLLFYLFVYLFYLFVCYFVYLFIYLFCLFIYLFINLFFFFFLIWLYYFFY
jgi:hypothetical protein